MQKKRFRCKLFQYLKCFFQCFEAPLSIFRSTSFNVLKYFLQRSRSFSLSLSGQKSGPEAVNKNYARVGFSVSSSCLSSIILDFVGALYEDEGVKRMSRVIIRADERTSRGRTLSSTLTGLPASVDSLVVSSR